MKPAELLISAKPGGYRSSPIDDNPRDILNFRVRTVSEYMQIIHHLFVTISTEMKVHTSESLRQ